MPFILDKTIVPIPTKPGLWFYTLTNFPVRVVRKEDENLYFVAGQKDDEIMAVEEYNTLKANSEFAAGFGFRYIHEILESNITNNYKYIWYCTIIYYINSNLSSWWRYKIKCTK